MRIINWWKLLLPLLLVVSTSTTTTSNNIDQGNEQSVHRFTKKLYMAETVDDIERFLTKEDPSNRVLVIIVFKDDCPACWDLLPKFELAWKSLPDFPTSLPGVQLPVSSTTYPWLVDEWGVSNTPSILFFIRQVEGEDYASDYVLEYLGDLHASVDELRQGLECYWKRLQHSGRLSYKYQTTMNQEDVPMEYLQGGMTIHAHSLAEMQELVQRYRYTLLHHLPTPLDPNLSQKEQEWIRYLLAEENYPEPFYVICYCEDIHETEEIDEFHEIAYRLSWRRNVAFCTLEECGKGEDNEPSVETAIRIYQVNNDWNLDPMAATPSKLSVSKRVTRALRPTLLWLDRQMTAPIAMDPQYSTHAVLFVNFHEESTKEDMKHAVQGYREACRSFHDEIVCLVVPSTDTRILTTFGIDLWTQLDKQATRVVSVTASPECQKTEKEDQKRNPTTTTPLQVLPTVLITDQRDNTGIRRYYLDPPFDKDGLGQFFNDVWRGKATPEVKSSNPNIADSSAPIKTNAHHVHSLTAHNWNKFTSTTQKHSLVLLYAPTCGHCKRFMIIWNALGDLLHYLGFDKYLQLGKLDVSTNEFFVQGVVSPYLPDVYYFHGDVVIPYEGPDGISDPLDIIEWWLDVMENDNIDENVLLQELEASYLERDDGETEHQQQ